MRNTGSTRSTEGKTITAAKQAKADAAKTVVRCETNDKLAQIDYLSWDTEGGSQTKMNLLRAPVELIVEMDGKRLTSKELATQVIGSGKARSYVVSLNKTASVAFAPTTTQGGKLRFAFTGRKTTGSEAPRLELRFPFQPRVTATTVLSNSWMPLNNAGLNNLRLPALISAPDFGQMSATCAQHPNIEGQFTGDRTAKTTDFTLLLPIPQDGETFVIELSPIVLPMPAGEIDAADWKKVRRGWFGMLQTSAAWSRPGNSIPAGVWSNHVISDPVSSLIWMLGDNAILVPELAPGVKTTDILRRALEHWIFLGTTAEGYVHYNSPPQGGGDSMTSNGAVLSATWSYVEASKDREWARRNINRLELIGNWLARRDLDGDGLVESKQSGNTGTKSFGDTEMDTISSGWKNARANAITYRGWRGLADLEKQLGRTRQAAKYTLLADRLKASYKKTFYLPKEGWIGWWVSQDGKMHGYAPVSVNGMAVLYGLVDAKEGKAIVRALLKKMQDVGYTRFDVGLPVTLVSVLRDDQFSIYGGVTPDGSDSFKNYCNGGACPSEALSFITACYVVGEKEIGDTMLNAMLNRQAKPVFANGGSFQNGIKDTMGEGPEFYTWDGKPSGYEGHLTFSFEPLHGAFLRHASYRAKVYRALMPAKPVKN